LFIGGAWQPQYNLSYSPSFVFSPRTEASEAMSGAETLDARPARRVARGSLDWLSESEAMGVIFDLQRQIGDHGEVLYIYDPDDVINRVRRSFLGRLRRLSPITHPYLHVHQWPFEIQEIL